MGTAYHLMQLRSRLEWTIDAGRRQDDNIVELRQRVNACEDKNDLALQLAAKAFCQVNPDIQACQGIK